MFVFGGGGLGGMLWQEDRGIQEHSLPWLAHTQTQWVYCTTRRWCVLWASQFPTEKKDRMEGDGGVEEEGTQDVGPQARASTQQAQNPLWLHPPLCFFFFLIPPGNS